MSRRARVILAGLVLSGCAPHDAGFSDVRRTIADRTGQRVAWDPDRDVDAEVPAQARELLARPLTAETAGQIALLNNRGLRARIEGLGIARADLVGASVLPNPRIEATLRVPQGGRTSELEAVAEVRLVDLLLLPGRRSAAASSLEAEKLRVAGAVLELLYRTRRAFFVHQADLQLLALRRTALAAAAAGYEAARVLHEAGNIPDLDLHLRQALYEETRITVAGAEAAALESRQQLLVLLGLWGRDATLRLADRLAEPPADELDLEHVERRAVERSLDLLEARRRIEAASTRIGVARGAGVLPGLSGGVAVERRDDETNPGQTVTLVGPTVTVTLPLFDQGQGQVGRAVADLRQREEGIAALAVEVRGAAVSAAQRVRAAHQRVVHHREVLLPLRRQIVEDTLQQSNAMQVGVFQVLQAKREEIDAERQGVEALRDYWIARAGLEEVLAGRIPRGEAMRAAESEDRPADEEEEH